MNKHYHICIVDDEESNLESLERILRSDKATIRLYRDPYTMIKDLQSFPCDILLTDLRMKSLTGIELLHAVKTHDPFIEVIVMTAYGTVELAVEAMKKGAYDFISKPLQRMAVIRSVERALEKRNLVRENTLLKEELESNQVLGAKEILGKSEAMRSVMEVMLQAANSRANVLIEGESGTGKGMVAEFLHQRSKFRTGIFVKINCSAIPENLLEAELFGYEPGAFTGASRVKKGRVELAHGGTLFLDEIGIAPLTFQAKLLRFLQEGEFERLGSNQTHQVETRVVSATNVDLKRAIEQGQFREDLYYRLNVVHVRLPALRERPEDIPLLAARFLAAAARKNGRETPLLRPDALEAFMNYGWPGNVRELQNLIERLVVLDRDGIIGMAHLPAEFGNFEKRARSISIPLGVPLRHIEKILIDEALKSSQGDKKLAARLLGIHPRTVYRHLEGEQAAEEEGQEKDLGLAVG